MLATAKRMREREVYEQYKQRKEEEQRILKQQQDDIKKQQDELELKKLRANAVVHAQPFVNRKEEFVKVQPKPVTQPVTPNVMKRIPKPKKNC